jgi:hypothetical protein
VLEPVADADHLEPAVDRLDGDRADDAVDARGRAAADHDAELAASGVRHDVGQSVKIVGGPGDAERPGGSPI